MQTHAILFEEPKQIALKELPIARGAQDNCFVDVLYSGISTGTERLLYDGKMPDFPGMGYPLVPGYESVGRVSRHDNASNLAAGDLVFVPGARCFDGARSLFGATASTLSVDAARLIRVPESLGRNATLLSLAATAYHAVHVAGGNVDLIIGHGVLGRLIARICLALDLRAPMVWENNPARMAGATDYQVLTSDDDPHPTHQSILDASGDPNILDLAIARLGRGGTVTLAGFYSSSLAFAFAPAFMREATIRIAAEFTPANVSAVLTLVDEGRLSLDGLISDMAPANNATEAYEEAFYKSACTKMILDWRDAR